MKKTNVSSEVLILSKTKSVLGSFWDHFGVHFGVHFGHLFHHFGDPFLDQFLEPFWDHFGAFWSPFWSHVGPKGRQDEPKSAIKSLKEQTSCIFKNLKKTSVFVFEVQRLPKRPS